MSKSTTTRPVWFVLWAVIAAIVALNTWQAFDPGTDEYQPTCDHQQMQRGDGCIGSGGGSYDEMVDDHYRDEQLTFVVSCPLSILFAGLAIRARRYRRRVQKTS